MSNCKKQLVTICKADRFEQLIRKSRFVAQARRCDTDTEAEAYIADASDPKASHNCWAYRVGDVSRHNDDGEPGGTAGRPILAAIDNEGVDLVAVVVSRYYGGIKLGTGGLARAYGGTAAKCVEQASKHVQVIPVAVTLTIPIEHQAVVYQLLNGSGGSVLSQHFDDQGWVRLDMEIDPEHLESFRLTLINSSRGQVKFHDTEPD